MLQLFVHLLHTHKCNQALLILWSIIDNYGYCIQTFQNDVKLRLMKSSVIQKSAYIQTSILVLKIQNNQIIVSVIYLKDMVGQVHFRVCVII